MSATATLNDRPQRKQLSDQLDRMDSIIDTLAEGLPGAVADACREGARAAVKDAVIEIMSNPELRAMLVPILPQPIPANATPAPETPPKPSIWDRLRAKIAAARTAITRTAVRVKDSMVSPCKALRDAVVGIGQATGEMMPVRRILFTTLCVGVVVGFGCWVMPQTVAAGVSGVSAACTTLAVQTGNWLNRAARRFGLVM